MFVPGAEAGKNERMAKAGILCGRFSKAKARYGLGARRRRVSRVCVKTAAGAAACDRRPLFFNSLGAHGAPHQLKNGSFHTDSPGREAFSAEHRAGSAAV